MLQRFWFSDARKGIARHGLDQFQSAESSPPVRLDPIFHVAPELRVKHRFPVTAPWQAQSPGETFRLTQVYSSRQWRGAAQPEVGARSWETATDAPFPSALPVRPQGSWRL